MAKVLAIDDSAAIREVLSHTLNSANHQIILAEDGSIALQKLHENPGIDLILCDVNMPVMDGIEFLQALKTEAAHAPFRFLPVIMLTTVTDEDMKLQGQSLGARAWVTKPIQPDKLLRAIEKLSAMR